MNTSLTIAAKELKVFTRKKTMIYFTILLPLLLSVLFSVIVENRAGRYPTGIKAILPTVLPAFSFFFVITAVILPTSIASYSIVGEKIQKSLEPLLATPTTDNEILLGKSIAAFVPPILATWLGASIFMAVIDILTHGELGYYYFPNWETGIILLLLAPVASVLSIELTVTASSRVNDIRAANQLGGLMFVPFMIVFLAGEIGVFTFDSISLLIISAALFLPMLPYSFSVRPHFKERRFLEIVRSSV